MLMIFLRVAFLAKDTFKLFIHVKCCASHRLFQDVLFPHHELWDSIVWETQIRPLLIRKAKVKQVFENIIGLIINRCKAKLRVSRRILVILECWNLIKVLKQMALDILLRGILGILKLRIMWRSLNFNILERLRVMSLIWVRLRWLVVVWLIFIVFSGKDISRVLTTWIPVHSFNFGFLNPKHFLSPVLSMNGY